MIYGSALRHNKTCTIIIVVVSPGQIIVAVMLVVAMAETSVVPKRPDSITLQTSSLFYIWNIDNDKAVKRVGFGELE